MTGIGPAAILYVDNDPESCQLIKTSFLRDETEFDVVCITGAEDALDRIRRQSFDLYILEYSLIEMTGAELCRKIRVMNRSTPVVIYSALFREIDRETAMKAGATAFVVKADGLGNLSATIRRLLTRRPVISRHYHAAKRSTSIF
jgi:DNA-binding response OmpR family regulator